MNITIINLFIELYPLNKYLNIMKLWLYKVIKEYIEYIYIYEITGIFAIIR